MAKFLSFIVFGQDFMQYFFSISILVRVKIDFKKLNKAKVEKQISIYFVTR